MSKTVLTGDYIPLGERLELNRKLCRPTLVLGPPGLSKSAQISKIGKQSAFYAEERPSTWDPVDARGMPAIRRTVEEAASRLMIANVDLQTAERSGDESLVRDAQARYARAIHLANQAAAEEFPVHTAWSRPTFLPPENWDDTVTIFFDELTNAAPAVMNVLLQPFQAAPGDPRMLGPHVIRGRNIWLVAAGNRKKDKAHVNPMGAPLRNRLSIIEVEPDETLLRSWTSWASQNDIHPAVVAFVNSRDKMMYAPPSDEDSPFPTLRSWSEGVSPKLNLLTRGELGKLSVEQIAEDVGIGAAHEFNGFLDHLDQIPSIEAIMRDPNSFKYDEAQTSVLYMLAVETAFRVVRDPDLYERGADVAMKIKPEIAMLFFKTLSNTDGEMARQFRRKMRTYKPSNDWFTEQGSLWSA